MSPRRSAALFPRSSRGKDFASDGGQAEGVIGSNPPGASERLRRGRVEDQHRRDAGADQEDLPHRASIGPAAVKAGNQIGHGHIEKTRCRQGQEIGKNARRISKAKIAAIAPSALAKADRTFSSSARLREYPA